MSAIRLRRATRADKPFFREMEFRTTWDSLNPADRERLTPDELHRSLEETHESLLDRPGNHIVIAEDAAGERVGLLWYGINRNLVTGEDEAWVYNVSVVAERQGEGIGRQLMTHAEELAREQGFPVLGLMVAGHNAPARTLYERLDFHVTNMVMRKQLR